jgi:hypothetical protein
MNKFYLTTKTTFVVMKKFYGIALLMFFVIATPLSILAQTNGCGMTKEDLHTIGERLKENRKHNYIHTRGAVAYVPVVFHLVARTDGTGRVPEGRVLDMLTGWNEIYAANNLDIQFYLKSFNYISNDNVYTSPRAGVPVDKMLAVKKLDAMNVYCVDKADGVGTLGQTLAYYSPSEDWIVCINAEVTRGKSPTIAHEVGHFFSLLHPFNGYDNTPFDPAKVPNGCAPALAPDLRPLPTGGQGYVLTENVARTGPDMNCIDGGDFLCDTPEDYNLGYGYSGCVYNGGAKDPKCVAVNPDETLLMGYFLNCGNKITGDQKTAILKDFNTGAKHAYLKSGNVVPYTQEIGQTTLQLPANNATTATFNLINFDWADVAGVVGYILEVSTSQTNFDIGRRFYINSATSQLTLNTANAGTYFAANKTYYWHVRAFGSYKTNTIFTNNFVFTTGTSNAVNEIPGIGGFTISPNPVGEAKLINIGLTSEKAFKANVKVQNLAGQVLINEVKNFDSGASNQLFEVKNLSSGMYILSIENEQGVLNKKIVVE